MIERDAREPLRLVGLVDTEQVVHSPHALGQLRLGEYPAAAEPAQAVNLGQAVRADELRTEMRGAPTRRDGGVEIDLVDQDARVSLAAIVRPR